MGASLALICFPLSRFSSDCSSFSCLVISGYLAFLAVDWLRTVSASHHFFLHFTLIVLQFICPVHSLPSYLCWVVRPPSPSSPFSGPSPSPVVSLWLICFAVFLGLVVSSLPAYPVRSLSFGFVVLSSLGSVPGLSGRRLVQDFQHPPSPPHLVWIGSFHLDRLSLCDISPKILQCGTSDRRLVRGITTLAPPTHTIVHCLWP